MIREWNTQRDDRRLRELYPDTAKQVMPYVEEACDQLEYSGSRMYDEFPDKFMLQKIYADIHQRVKDQLEIQSTEGDFLEELIQVLLCHEMFSRRCSHNQCKRCRR